jgi:hypothetical protein
MSKVVSCAASTMTHFAAELFKRIIGTPLTGTTKNDAIAMHMSSDNIMCLLMRGSCPIVGGGIPMVVCDVCRPLNTTVRFDLVGGRRRSPNIFCLMMISVTRIRYFSTFFYTKSSSCFIVTLLIG